MSKLSTKTCQRYLATFPEQRQWCFWHGNNVIVCSLRHAPVWCGAHVLVVQVISEAGAGAGGEWVNYLVSLHLLSTHGTSGHWSLAPGHPVIQSYSHPVIHSSRHAVIQTSCHTDILSYRYPVMQSSCHEVILSNSQAVLSNSHLVKQSNPCDRSWMPS